VERTGHKGLPLILAREFAANVAVPIFLVDPDNTLIYYNDAAIVAFGKPFSHAGELTSGQWSPKFHPTRPDGSPYDRDDMPIVIALTEHRPAHGVHQVTSPEGERVLVEFSCMPLFSTPEEFVGVMVSFWPAEEPNGQGGKD
jgi:PAS domain-containing protein